MPALLPSSKILPALGRLGNGKRKNLFAHFTYFLTIPFDWKYQWGTRDCRINLVQQCRGRVTMNRERIIYAF